MKAAAAIARQIIIDALHRVVRHWVSTEHATAIDLDPHSPSLNVKIDYSGYLDGACVELSLPRSQNDRFIHLHSDELTELFHADIDEVERAIYEEADKYELLGFSRLLVRGRLDYNDDGRYTYFIQVYLPEDT